MDSSTDGKEEGINRVKNEFKGRPGRKWIYSYDIKIKKVVL